LLEKLGATGAGLNPADVRPGSRIAGIIDEIRDKWPWWDDLHSFWRELPNYNPIGVQSSEPGTDHAADAEQLFLPPSAAVSSGDEHEDDGSSATSELQEEHGSEYQDPGSDGDEDEEEEDWCFYTETTRTLDIMVSHTPSTGLASQEECAAADQARARGPCFWSDGS